MADWCRSGDEFKIVVDVGPFEAFDVVMRADRKQVTIRASHGPRPVGPGVFSRQFHGQIPLPVDLDSGTLRATFVEGHLVVITGTTSHRPLAPSHFELIIPVFAVHDRPSTGRSVSHSGIGPGGP